MENLMIYSEELKSGLEELWLLMMDLLINFYIKKNVMVFFFKSLMRY